MKHNFEKIFENYDARDVSNFTPSPAIYFMNGTSEAHIKILKSGEEIHLAFEDQNTSIAASAPQLYKKGQENEKLYVPVPEPLHPFARFPFNTPHLYKRETSYHLMQVVSMNMEGNDSKSSLLIGLPYAAKYPHIFFNSKLFQDEKNSNGESYGVVTSLTDFEGSANSDHSLRIRLNGYPARSFFGIYHIIETPIGALFNKKATQMELQPDKNGKLALALPPIPFSYSLINGPIPLFHVDDPSGNPIAHLDWAKHNADKAANIPSANAWPWFKVDLHKIEKQASKSSTSASNIYKIK